MKRRSTQLPLQEHELTTLQIAALSLCRAILAGDCNGFDKQRIPQAKPSSWRLPAS